MATDTQAMTLLIRLMPLMQREFSLRIDPGSFFADPGYRDAIIGSALTASEPRLRGYAEQLRSRMAELSRGTPGVLRAPANSPAPVSFDRTTPGDLHPFAQHLQPGTPPDPAATPAPQPPEPPPGQPARKYIGRLR